MNSFMQNGYAAVQSENFSEAVTWFEKATHNDDKNIQAKCCLGQSLCWLGKRREGIDHLRQAGKQLLKNSRKNKDISQATLLAEQLQYWNDYAGALELAKQIVQINSSDAGAFHLLTTTYSRLNQNKLALVSGRQALKLAPHNLTLHLLQATLESVDKQYPAARQRLENLLQQTPTPEQAFRAHKELAIILEKLGEHGLVFKHLHTSTALSAAVPEIQQQDFNLVPDMIKANQAGFDRDLLGRWRNADFLPDQPAPVFLIGFLRSGTTLTQEVIGAHPNVFVADESNLIISVYKELARISGDAGSAAEQLRRIDAADVKHLREFYWRKAHERYGDAIKQRLFLDKTTMNTLDLGLINCIFPDAKVVFVMRDPRDVCLSCFMQIMVPTPSTVHLLSWQSTAEFYAMTMNWWLHIKQLMTIEYIEFRYEDAVAEFERTYRQVFDFLKLSWDPKVIDFHKHAAKKFIVSPSFSQVAQPLYNSSIARWQPYQAELAAIQPIIDPFIKTFAYQ
ncbi:MAG: sulfotransferase [Methylococcales bacterium]